VTGLTLLERAAFVAREHGELPPHADAIIGMLALSIIGMVRFSPDDEAERLEQIAACARRLK
jgi:hypothetical protein